MQPQPRRHFLRIHQSRPTLKESIHKAIHTLNASGQVIIKTWEECRIGGKFVINTICNED